MHNQGSKPRNKLIKKTFYHFFIIILKTDFFCTLNCQKKDKNGPFLKSLA